MASIEFKFNMGDKLKDTVSGFVGIVRGQYFYANGCKHYGLAPITLSKDGRIMDHENLDENRLILVKPASKKKIQKPTGGPVSMPRMK